MTQERPYVPSEDFGTVDHDDFQLDWLEEARSNSDLYLLSGWARLRVETLRAERDSLATQLEQMRRDLAEARATNARLHRRAQGVEAGKPEDEETIRRLRAEVRATAKRAGYVAGHVYRIIDARNAEMRRAYEAIRERDEARAKLARIREAASSPRMHHFYMSDIVRIIDEKEGDQ